MNPGDICGASKAPPIYSSVAESNAYFRPLGRCLAAVTFVHAHDKLAKQYARSSQDPNYTETL